MLNFYLVIKILTLHFCDKRKTISNDIWDVYNTLGISATKKILNKELWNALCSDNYIDKRHIELLVNSMTYQGIIMPVRREGIDKNVGVMAKSSFEQTLENFIQASAIGEKDDLSSISSRIFVGELINSGTGFCDLVPNYEMANNNKKVEFTPKLEIKRKDKFEKDKSEKDIFLEKLEKWY